MVFISPVLGEQPFGSLVTALRCVGCRHGSPWCSRWDEGSSGPCSDGVRGVVDRRRTGRVDRGHACRAPVGRGQMPAGPWVALCARCVDAGAVGPAARPNSCGLRTSRRGWAAASVSRSTPGQEQAEVCSTGWLRSGAIRWVAGGRPVSYGRCARRRHSPVLRGSFGNRRAKVQLASCVSRVWHCDRCGRQPDTPDLSYALVGGLDDLSARGIAAIAPSARMPAVSGSTAVLGEFSPKNANRTPLQDHSRERGA
jgi:hypothetical protein